MAAAVARQKCHFAAFEHAANIGVRRRAERRLHAYFFHFCQPRHGIQSAAADNANLRLSQTSSEKAARLLYCFARASQTRDYTRHLRRASVFCGMRSAQAVARYNLPMRFLTGLIALLFLPLSRSGSRCDQAAARTQIGHGSHHARSQPNRHRRLPAAARWNEQTRAGVGRHGRPGITNVSEGGQADGTRNHVR